MNRKILYVIAITLLVIGSLSLYYFNLDSESPKIHFITYDPQMLSREVQTFIINASDNFQIEKIIISIFAPEGSTIFSEEASLIDDLYRFDFDATIFIGEKGFPEGNYTLEVTASDEAGNSDTFSSTITVTYALQDSFLKWAQDKGFDKNLAQSYWDSYTEMVEYNFETELNKLHLEKALELEETNPNLNNEIYELSSSDKSFPNMTAMEIYNVLANEVLRLRFDKVGLNLPRRTFNMVGNLSCFVRERGKAIPVVDLVWRLGNFTLSNELNFSIPREYYSALLLVEKITGIEQYPNLLRGSCEQIEYVIYNNNLHTVKGESYAINNLAIPAIEYVTGLINNGVFDINDFTDEEAGRLAIPIELTEVAIVDPNKLPEKVSYIVEWPMGTSAEHLKIGVDNVKPNENLGRKSPQEWLGELVWEVYRTKGDRYEIAISDGIRTRTLSWPNSLKYFQEIAETLVKKDDISIFIQGCGALGIKIIDVIEREIVISGQEMSFYSVLVGRVMGKPVKLFRAPYPTGNAMHVENFTKTIDEIYPYIGLYGLDTDIFLSDYQNTSKTPWLAIRQRDGTWNYVVWLKH